MKKHLINSSRPQYNDELVTERSIKKIKLHMNKKESLQVKNSHDRDFQIKFIEDGHCYIKENGEKFRISVSGLEGMFFAPFDREKSLQMKFRYPQRDQEGKFILKNNQKIVGGTGKSLPPDYGLTRKECIEKQEQTPIFGTMIHKQAEEYLELQLDPSIPIEKRITNFINKEEFTKEEFFVAKQIVDCELEWIREGWRVYRTEWTIFDEDLNLAGQVDVVLQRRNGENKEYMVLDWKTTRHPMSSNFTYDDKHLRNAFYPINHLPATLEMKYYIQMSIYASILKRRYGMNVTQIRACGIHTDKRNSEVKTSPPLFEEVSRIFKCWESYLVLENALKTWEIEGRDSLNGVLPIPKDPPFFRRPISDDLLIDT